MRQRWSAEWPDADGALRVHEPTDDEIAAAAPALCAFYNDPHNRAMLAHDDELTVDEVVEHFAGLYQDGAHPFLLAQEERLIGDGDLRHVDDRFAEAAIMVGERAVQGRGLGTRFGVMVHALAFRAFGLERVYATIIPANRASLRLFAKLGYVLDDSPQARGYIDADDDVSLSLDRARFEELHGAAADRIRLVRSAL
jgi:RimJ/RimL family protein N-acetyltransferase